MTLRAQVYYHQTINKVHILHILEHLNPRAQNHVAHWHQDFLQVPHLEVLLHLHFLAVYLLEDSRPEGAYRAAADAVILAKRFKFIYKKLGSTAEFFIL